MSNTVIKVEGLGKKYQIRHQRQGGRYVALRDVISDKTKTLGRGVLLRGRQNEKFQKKEEFWALKDINFEVKQGEKVGIIGRNGAGKSTLLKLVSRITEPTVGKISLKGRVASLLEVGTGFHPELTGRENIFLNGAILGMGKSEIKRKFDEIVSFSEVEQFLDTPVKRYSSGMYVRLAFSVAAHLEPEILLVDEVLAVGDAEFQRKCLGKMGDVAREGRTVLFVSHNMAAINRLCSRCILLERGGLKEDGSTDGVIAQYQTSMSMDLSLSLTDRKDRVGTGNILFTEVSFVDPASNRSLESLISGNPVRIEMKVSNSTGKMLNNVSAAIIFVDSMGTKLFTCYTHLLNANFNMLAPTSDLACNIPALPLAQGCYSISLWISVGGEIADYVDSAAQFSVMESDYFGSGRTTVPNKHGPILVTHAWLSRDIT